MWKGLHQALGKPQLPTVYICSSVKWEDVVRILPTECYYLEKAFANRSWASERTV